LPALLNVVGKEVKYYVFFIGVHSLKGIDDCQFSFWINIVCGYLKNNILSIVARRKFLKSIIFALL